MHIAVFLPNWLGDLVMATPTLRALRRRFGEEARLVGVMRPPLMPLLNGTPWLDERWPLDPHVPGAWRAQMELVARLRRVRFDLALLLSNSLRTALVAWLGGVRERIGYVRYGRGLLLTARLEPPRQQGRLIAVPMVDYYLRLAERVGCGPESPRLELATTPEDEALADRVWRVLGLPDDGRVVLLHSSSARGPAKCWPEGHAALLARKIAQQLDHDVLVVCGPQDRQTARRIAQLAAHPRVHSLADQPVGLGLSKACIRRGRLMVSTDSGPRHVAAAFGKPLITLFGPTSPVWVANPTVRSVDLMVPLPCSGCGQRQCPAGHHRCMNELGADLVFARVAECLGSHEVKAA